MNIEINELNSFSRELIIDIMPPMPPGGGDMGGMGGMY